MKVHPQQQADMSSIPAYHRRKDAATDHGVQSWRYVTRLRWLPVSFRFLFFLILR